MEREFVDRDSLSVLAAATSDGEEEEVDRDQSDNDEEDGGNTTSDTKEIGKSPIYLLIFNIIDNLID